MDESQDRDTDASEEMDKRGMTRLFKRYTQKAK